MVSIVRKIPNKRIQTGKIQEMEVIILPAAKDHLLLKGNWTKEQIAQKEKEKASVTPSVKLKVPEIIKDNVNYYAIWKRTLKLYSGTELLNALDTDMLSRYCIETSALKSLYRERGNYDDDVETMLKIEMRIEAKTKMLNQMALALYMAPRARAGSIPGMPDKVPKDDSNADMFD